MPKTAVDENRHATAGEHDVRPNRSRRRRDREINAEAEPIRVKTPPQLLLGLRIAAPVPAISSFASPDEAFSSCGGLPKGMRKSPRARTTPRTPTTFRRRLTCDVRIASMARGEEEIAPAPQARFMTLRAEARRVPYDSPTHKFVPGVAKP